MDPRTLSLIMGAAGVSGAAATYVEDVFSTWLYTGNGSTQTITNGIDLSGKGGLVWTKARGVGAGHALYDTDRGATKFIQSDTTVAQITASTSLTSFNADGFTLGADAAYGYSNYDGYGSYASWTFRKQAKFFDVVTYTGNGSNRTISHSLGSVPGCIIVKRTDTTGDWQVYHRSLANTEYLVLNTTTAKATGTTRWNSTTPTSTEFSLGTDATVNANTGTYVAYLFAHDAGGFGDSGSDSVVKCGSYTYSATSQTIDLGWEPQWVLVKASSTTGSWSINDNMRGLGFDSTPRLRANLSNAEQTTTPAVLTLNATGFTVNTNNADYLASGETYIYIAIRRGPMKKPTDATKVFSLATYTGNGVTVTALDSGIVSDAYSIKRRTGSTSGWKWMARMTTYPGANYENVLALDSTSTAAASNSDTWSFQRTTPSNTDIFKVGQDSLGNWSVNSSTYTNYAFRRAPGFFDVVAYTGTASARTVSHNLGVAPELIIGKSRNGSQGWIVYAQGIGNSYYLRLDLADAKSNAVDPWNSTTPTSSVFSLGTSAPNSSANDYIAYLFATLTGISKVGSYTGTATTLSIDCGFTAGARLVLIKRTDSTGDWYIWDTARGIVSGNDSYLLLNSTAAEVTNTDYIDPLSSGFQISSTAPAAINANGGSYVFLAVA